MTKMNHGKEERVMNDRKFDLFPALNDRKRVIERGQRDRETDKETWRQSDRETHKDIPLEMQ